MSVLNVIDGASASRYTKVTGTGDSGDPFVPSVNVDTVVPGTNPTSLGKAEDAPHVSGDTGVLVLAVRNDAGSTLAGTTGDYIPLGTDSSGNLRVTSGGGGLSANVAGDVAHDAVDSGDPVKVGGYAKATAPTAVSADGDRVNAWFDLAGRLAVQDGGGNLSIDDGGNVISVDDAGTTLSVDDGGSTLSIDDGAGSITIDGSVTVSGTVTANAGTGTLAVSLASLPALTAGSATIGATQDAGPSWTTVWGVSGIPFTSADQHSAAASVSDAPTGGQKLVIDDLVFSVDTAMSVTFKCETSGTVVTGPFYMAANSTMQITPRGKGTKLATADKKLQVLTSVAGNIMVMASYHSEA